MANLPPAGYLVPDPGSIAPTMPLPPGPSADVSGPTASIGDFDPNNYISEQYLDFSQASYPNLTPLPPVPDADQPNFNMNLADPFFPFGKAPQIDYYTQFDEVRQQIKSQAQSAMNTPPNGATGTLPSTSMTNQPQVDETSSFPAYTSRPAPLYEEGLFDFSAGLNGQGSSTFTSTPRAVYSQFAHFNTPTSDQSGTPSNPADPKLRSYRNPRETSLPKSSPSSASTPDSAIIGPPLNSTVDPKTPNQFGRPLPSHAMLYGQQSITSARQIHVSHIDPIDGITESLGEFLFSPANQGQEGQASEGATLCAGDDPAKRKRRGTGDTVRPRSKSLIKVESDGMTDSAREVL